MNAAQNNPNARITAIADVREEAARSYAEEYRVPHVFYDGRKLIESGEADAIILALPAIHRFDLAASCLKRKLNVLIEKPVARNVDEVQTLIDLQSDSVAGCCSARYRVLPLASHVEKALAEGAIGNLRQIRVRLSRPTKARPESPPPVWRLNRRLNGGGFMSNWGCYFLDFILGVFRWSLVPRQISGQVWGIAPELSDYVPEGSDAEVKLAAQVRLLNDATIDLDLGEYAYTPEESVVEIHGTSGALRFNMVPEHPSRLFHYTVDRSHGIVERVLWEGDQDHGLVHAGVVDNFIAAVRGTETIKTDLHQAMIVQRITDGLYASAAEGRSVPLVV